MLLALKNIESEFSEQLVLLAESLLDLGSVSNPKRVEKNLWSMEVSQDVELSFEVEIQISSKKIKAFSCDCENFTANKKCEHSVAGMLQLRKYLNLKALKKRTEQRPTSTAPKKLNISSVLNNVSHDELKEFIRAYSRQDKRFSLAIKAKFANAVQLEDSKEKYTQLLNATITAVRKTDGTINYNGTLQTKKVVNDVLDHLEDALAMEHYREVVDMLQAILEKIIPIIRITAPNEKILAQIIGKTLNSLKELTKEKLPQDLKNEMWEFCLQEINKGTYRKHQIQKDLYDNLFVLTDEKKKALQVLEKIDSLLIEQSSRENIIPLLLFKFDLLEKYQPKLLDKFIEANLKEKEILMAAIVKTFQTKDFSTCKQLAIKGLQTQTNPHVKNELNEYLLKVALATEDKKDIIQYSRIRFFATLDFSYFKILKSKFDKKWNAELKSILQELEATPYHPKKKVIFAEIYSSENLPHELFTYIKKIRSLELLQQYDELLLEFSKQDVYVLYEDLIVSYLQSHVGRKASEKIRVILFHLKKIGANKLVSKLIKEFKSEYKERHTLMEELAYF